MTSANPPADAEIAPPSLEEVGAGVFAYVQHDGSWCLNNPSFVAGDTGVIAVDAAFTERRTRDFKAAIERTSDQPISTLISTHHHADHTFGNFVFGPTTTLVAHENGREKILGGAASAVANSQGMFPNVDLGNIEIVPPSVTFDDAITLYAGDLRLECLYVGPAHTNNDVVIWIPDREVLITGDIVFNNGTPLVLSGSIAGWIDAIDGLRELGAKTLIPGHGPVCGPELFDDMTAYLRFVQAAARKGFEADATELEVAIDLDLGRFSEWLDRERIVGNLFRAYSELRGEAQSAPVDEAAARAGMVTYNGGEPLRCIA
jgi:cyclase